MTIINIIFKTKKKFNRYVCVYKSKYKITIIIITNYEFVRGQPVCAAQLVEIKTLTTKRTRKGDKVCK